MLRIWILLIVSICLLRIRVEGEQWFPEPRVSRTLLQGDWIASPIVVVGEVANISKYGKQTIDRLPPPTTPDAQDLYWCQGDLQVAAVVKGEFHAPSRRYLWASTIPGCKLWDDDPKFIFHRQQTRAWFLREEGGFLRPPFDYGTYRYIGLLDKWEGGPDLPAPERLGALLLAPGANADTLDDYADYLWDVGDIACELLGKAECARRIRELTTLGSPKLRDQACGFLKGQLNLPGDCRSR
jgi:hypothetical protein